MPKYINSASYELGLAKAEIESLTKRNHEKDARILQLEAYIKRNNLPLPNSSPSQATTNTNGSRNNFLRPTVASLNRRARVPQQEASEDAEKQKVIRLGTYRDLQYRDGALVKVPNPDSPYAGFRRTTISAENKQREKFSKNENNEQSPDDDEDGYLAWVSRHSRDSHWSYLSHRWSGDDLEETPDVENKSPGEAAKKGLMRDSRIGEKSPENLDCIPIRSKFLYAHLKRGLSLAKEIFFYGNQKYHPEIVKNLQGPEEVRLGRSELQGHFFNKIGSQIEIAGNWYQRGDLVYEFEEITNLRNIVSHYGACDTTLGLHHYDAFFQSVHYLAVIYGDRNRAFRARKLRDELVKAARDSLGEIERMVDFTELPQGRPWDVHHTRAFEQIVCTRKYQNGEYGDELPAAFLKAVRDWDLQRPVSGREAWGPKPANEVDLSLDNTFQEAPQDES
ncbi:hypothetical protein F5Y05DRAFT_415457 [Hypoxylon sp. FL0543]|nr:hypothetical protein F5Y05DRAFT_415457 [Hypoxylon sp. FL0543]